MKYTKHVRNECDYLFWLKIDKSAFDIEEDIYLANAYVPPEGSQYVTATCFDDIENEIVEFMKLSRYIIIGGDLNAYTNTRSDIIVQDLSDDAHSNNIQPDAPIVDPIETKLEALHIPVTRLAQDKHNMNNWGNKLIECCHDTGMCIVNGRYGESSSKCTTINDTTIDYFLCTPDTFDIIYAMSVHTYNPCLSDVHVPIDITLKCHDDATYLTKENNTEFIASMTNRTKQNKSKVRSWDHTKSKEFIDNLDKTSIRQINDKLDTFQPEDKLTQIDHVMTVVSDLFLNAGLKPSERKM